MTTLLAFAFVLGVLVFVHELGHFMVAKKVGVRVLKFQLGFNPTIASIRRGDTEYSIGAIPFGGYVKMAGDNPEDPLTGRDDEFLSKTKWQRFQILVMGPVMNIALAVVLMAFVLMQGADVPAFEDQPPVVGAVVPASPAARVGVQPGDRIVRVADREISTWEQFFFTISTRANQEVPLVLLREGRAITVRVVPSAQTRFELGDIGVLPDVHPHVRSLRPGDPAEQAGVKAGDVVVAVDDQPVTFAKQLSETIAKHPDAPITLTLLRDGKRLDLRVVPAKRGNIGVIGIVIGDEVKTIQPGPLAAFGLSIKKNYQFSGLIFQTVWGLITRETSPRQLMGPVAIAQLSGESAQAGWIALLTLMASISLNLGLLNLLPIPILDGGHILILAIEGVARRDFSIRLKEKMLLAGFVILMMLMVTVIYNDLARIHWIENLLPWR